MKRPTVFITYFQRSVQFEHVYQVLLSKHFFQKNGDCFNLTSIFPCLNNFCKKTYEKTYLFLHIYTNSLSRSTLSQSFTIWKFLLKKCQLFQNLNKFSLIWASLSNFCMKTYERTYRFYDIFSKFLLRPKFSQNFFTNFSNFEQLLRENLWKVFNLILIFEQFISVPPHSRTSDITLYDYFWSQSALCCMWKDTWIHLCTHFIRLKKVLN